MTHEEARAQFPVLERFAYLNAGTFGPLARPTVERCRSSRADLAEGRRARRTSRRCSRCARGCASARGARRRRAGAGRADALDDGRLQHRGRRPRARARRRDRDHDRRALRPARPARTRPARASSPSATPAAEAILAAVTPRTRLIALSQVLWTTGHVLPVRRAARADGHAGARRRRAVGRRDPGRRRGLDFFTVSGQKWLCGPDATGALVVADPERLRVGRPSYFSQASFEPAGASSRARAPRASTRLAPSAVLAGLLAALDVDRMGVRARRRAGCPLPRAARAARRGRRRARDARHLPARTSRRRRRAPRRGGRDRPRDPGDGPRPRVGRLVDERGRPRPSRGSGRGYRANLRPMRRLGGSRSGPGDPVRRGRWLRRAAPGEPFFVGFSEDLPKEIGSAAVTPAARARRQRVPADDALGAGPDALPAAEAAKLGPRRRRRGRAADRPRRLRQSGADAPQDPAARDAYCGYVGTSLAAFPRSATS